MTEIQKILAMLENVADGDHETMDEIDARVWCVEHQERFDFMDDNGTFFATNKQGKQICFMPDVPKYTRSIDAQNEIDTSGWDMMVLQVGAKGVDCLMVRHKNNLSIKTIHVFNLPTEPIARLHAKLQAVEWERGNAK